MLGKWFNTGGEIYIFDEPSLGIDVGSKQEIYKVMVDLLKEEKAILDGLIRHAGGDLDQPSRDCLQTGRLAGELTGEDITEENILTLSIGDRKA